MIQIVWCIAPFTACSQTFLESSLFRNSVTYLSLRAVPWWIGRWAHRSLYMPTMISRL